MISKLLNVNQKKRFSLEECLNHKFLKSTSVNSSFNDELEALSLSIEGIEIVKEKEPVYKSYFSVSDTNDILI